MDAIRTLGLAAVGASLAMAPALAGAQGAPKYADVEIPSTVQVTVAASAGGSTDALARVAMPSWEEAVEQLTGKDISTVIKNLPGAGTEIGATALATAKPDGSTIGLINLPHVPLLEASRDTQFEPWLESFTPLALNVVDPNVAILGERSSHETLEAAIQAAKENPGSVIVGSQGPMSDDQLALYALQDATGATFTYIPFDGGSDANRALRGGEIDITIGNVFDYIQLEDAAKDAVIFSPKRDPLIGQVPTVEEALGVKTGELASTRGFAAPAGLPEDVLALYREAFEVAFTNEDFKKEAAKRNITLVEPRIGDDFGGVMKEQQDIVGRLLRYFEEGGYLE